MWNKSRNPLFLLESPEAAAAPAPPRTQHLGPVRNRNPRHTRRRAASAASRAAKRTDTSPSSRTRWLAATTDNAISSYTLVSVRTEMAMVPLGFLGGLPAVPLVSSPLPQPPERGSFPRGAPESSVSSRVSGKNRFVQSAI